MSCLYAGGDADFYETGTNQRYTLGIRIGASKDFFVTTLNKKNMHKDPLQCFSKCYQIYIDCIDEFVAYAR